MTDRSTRSSVSITFRTVVELDEYVNSRLRFTLLEGARGILTLEERNNASEVIVLGEVRLE